MLNTLFHRLAVFALLGKMLAERLISWVSEIMLLPSSDFTYWGQLNMNPHPFASGWIQTDTLSKTGHLIFCLSKPWMLDKDQKMDDTARKMLFLFAVT
jgi:hypothetical protein